MKRHQKIRNGVLLLLMGLAPCACLWDRDTITMERNEWPGTLELLAGKFNRHSKAFYEWRIENREKELATASDPLPLLDDLGVAYDKTSQHALAIATGQKALSLNTNRYESLANLGTFLIHDGQFNEGLPLLKRAVEINPKAHFGREYVQILLVEYVMTCTNAEGQVVYPLQRPDSDSPTNFLTYATQANPQPSRGKRLPKAEQRKLIKGLEGMMHFGDHTHPALCEALGDLLGAGSTQRLQARAYLKAGQAFPEGSEPQKAYRLLAQSALTSQQNMGNVAQVEQYFLAEQKQGSDWFATLEKKERQWIASGDDPEAAWLRAYAKAPAKVSSRDFSNAYYDLYKILWYILVVAVSIIILRMLYRKAKRTPRRS